MHMKRCNHSGCTALVRFYALSSLRISFIKCNNSFESGMIISPTAVNEISTFTFFCPSIISGFCISILFIRVFTIIGVNSFISVHFLISLRNIFKSTLLSSEPVISFSVSATSLIKLFCYVS